VFPKRMGRADEFGHLVRMLIENDYMNAEVIRFDGGIRFQPKLRPATSGCHLTCVNVLSSAVSGPAASRRAGSALTRSPAATGRRAVRPERVQARGAVAGGGRVSVR
jgi:hypothetical protein